jgi:hypothetical protein
MLICFLATNAQRKMQRILHEGDKIKPFSKTKKLFN